MLTGPMEIPKSLGIVDLYKGNFHPTYSHTDFLIILKQFNSYYILSIVLNQPALTLIIMLYLVFHSFSFSGLSKSQIFPAKDIVEIKF